MSHPATAHLANWLGGSSVTDGSVAYYLASSRLPVWGSNTLPAAPSVYNEFEDEWVAYGGLPDTDDEWADIATPCLAVMYRGENWPEGPYAYEQANGSGHDGTIDLSVIVCVRGETKALNQRNAYYYARATKGSLYALGYGTDTQRTLASMGIRLGRVQSCKRANAQTIKGDYTALSAWDVQYAITESVPVSM